MKILIQVRHSSSDNPRWWLNTNRTRLSYDYRVLEEDAERFDKIEADFWLEHLTKYQHITSYQYCAVQVQS